MSMFSKMKKKSKTEGSNLSNLRKNLEKSGAYRSKDDRFYTPAKSSDGTLISARLRIMPAPYKDFERVESGEIPEDMLTPLAYRVKYSYQNKKTNKWYGELSRKMLGKEEPDPMGELKTALWDDESEDWKKKAQAIQRQEERIVNVFIISDKFNPEMNGQVKLMRINKSLFKFLDKADTPKFEDDTPIDPFSFGSDGADLILNLETEEKEFNGQKMRVADWGSAKWSSPCEFMDGDEAKQEEIWKQTHSLFDFIDPSKIKSYEELQGKVKDVYGLLAADIIAQKGGTVSQKEDVFDDQPASDKKYEPSKPKEGDKFVEPSKQNAESKKDDTDDDFLDSLEESIDKNEVEAKAKTEKASIDDEFDDLLDGLDGL